MRGETGELEVRRLIRLSRDTIEQWGVDEHSLRMIGAYLRQLASSVPLEERDDVRRLDQRAGAVVLGRESSPGMVLQYMYLPKRGPTPIHDHGTWGVSYVVHGEERYTKWDLISRTNGRIRENIHVHYERKRGPDDIEFWLDPPRDIHSQRALDRPVSELVLLGDYTPERVRHYYDHRSGVVMSSR